MTLDRAGNHSPSSAHEHAPGTPETLFIESGTARLFTMVYQRLDAETVILLHGGPGVPMDFTPIAEPLSCAYQVIVFEQRGTGRSPAPGASYAMEEYLGDIDVIATHFGLSRFHLFGHSWGGLYAQLYALNHPQRVLSMFLSSPSSGTGGIWKRTQGEVMAFNKARSSLWGWLKMGILSLQGALGSDRAYQELFKRVLANYHREFDPGFQATDAMFENVRAEPINKTLAKIVKYPLLVGSPDFASPILIAYGVRDIYGASRHCVRQRFPQAKFVEFEAAGHIAWKHNPAAFNAALKEFYRL